MDGNSTSRSASRGSPSGHSEPLISNEELDDVMMSELDKPIENPRVMWTSSSFGKQPDSKEEDDETPEEEVDETPEEEDDESTDDLHRAGVEALASLEKMKEAEETQQNRLKILQRTRRETKELAIKAAKRTARELKTLSDIEEYQKGLHELEEIRAAHLLNSFVRKRPVVRTSGSSEDFFLSEIDGVRRKARKRTNPALSKH
jgi:hypothetical protein